MIRPGLILASAWLLATTLGSPALAAEPTETITTPAGVTIALPGTVQTTETRTEDGEMRTAWRAESPEFSSQVGTFTLPNARVAGATPEDLLARAQAAKRESQPSRTKMRHEPLKSLKNGSKAWFYTLTGHGTFTQTLTIASPTADGVEMTQVSTSHGYRSDLGEAGARAVLESVALKGEPVRTPKTEP